MKDIKVVLRKLKDKMEMEMKDENGGKVYYVPIKATLF